MESAAFHLGALGDLVVALPALHALRRRAGPRSHLALFAGSAEKGALVVLGGAAHEAFDLSRADLAPLFSGGTNLPRWFEERIARLETAWVFLRDAQDVVLGLLRQGCKRVVAVDPRPPADRSDRHVVDWLLERIGSDVVRRPGAVAYPRLRVPALARTTADRTLRALSIEPGRGLAIHPGSGGLRKCWQLERFLETARRASSRGFSPLFILGPVELDARPGIALAIEAAGFPLVSAPALPDLAALALRSGTWLGNDAGSTHVAAAAGARTVALFGPSDPRVWAPRGRRVVVVRAPHENLEALEPAHILDVLSHDDPVTHQ